MFLNLKCKIDVKMVNHQSAFRNSNEEKKKRKNTHKTKQETCHNPYTKCSFSNFFFLWFFYSRPSSHQINHSNVVYPQIDYRTVYIHICVLWTFWNQCGKKHTCHAIVICAHSHRNAIDTPNKSTTINKNRKLNSTYNTCFANDKPIQLSNSSSTNQIQSHTHKHTNKQINKHSQTHTHRTIVCSVFMGIEVVLSNYTIFTAWKSWMPTSDRIFHIQTRV